MDKSFFYKKEKKQTFEIVTSSHAFKHILFLVQNNFYYYVRDAYQGPIFHIKCLWLFTAMSIVNDI